MVFSRNSARPEHGGKGAASGFFAVLEQARLRTASAFNAYVSRCLWKECGFSPCSGTDIHSARGSRGGVKPRSAATFFERLPFRPGLCGAPAGPVSRCRRSNPYLQCGIALLLWLAASLMMVYAVAASERPAPLSGTVVIEDVGRAETPQARRPSVRDGVRRAPRGVSGAPPLPVPSRPWHFSSASSRTRDPLWRQGLSHKTLGRKTTPPRAASGVPEGKGVDTQQSIDAALETAAPSGPSMHLSVGKNMTVRGSVSNQVTAWRNPITEPVRIGQEVIIERKNVMGAYADIDAGDDVTISAGPEYTIQSEQGLEQAGAHHNEPNSLGVGLRLEWAF